MPVFCSFFNECGRLCRELHPRGAEPARERVAHRRNIRPRRTIKRYLSAGKDRKSQTGRDRLCQPPTPVSGEDVHADLPHRFAVRARSRERGERFPVIGAHTKNVIFLPLGAQRVAPLRKIQPRKVRWLQNAYFRTARQCAQRLHIGQKILRLKAGPEPERREHSVQFVQGGRFKAMRRGMFRQIVGGNPLQVFAHTGDDVAAVGSEVEAVRLGQVRPPPRSFAGNGDNVFFLLKIFGLAAGVDRRLLQRDAPNFRICQHKQFKAKRGPYSSNIDVCTRCFSLIFTPMCS